MHETLAATPTKLRPTGINTEALHDSSFVVDVKKNDNNASEISTESNIRSEVSEDLAAGRPKQKSKHWNKRKKNSFKSKNENTIAANTSSNNNATFATESSSDAFEMTSPIETENSTTFTSKSTNTSFSDVSSRKPSVVSLISTPSFSETPGEDDTVSMKEISSKTLKIDETPITPKPAQLQSSSSKTPDTVVKRGAASGKTHSKKESAISTPNHRTSASMRKVDAKLAKSDGEVQSPEAKINFDDQKEFPFLGPIRSPVSSIADGKRPAGHVPAQRLPRIGSFSEPIVTGSGKNQAKPAVPVVAIPRSYMHRQASQP
jgi:hypothetical protein